MISRFVPALAEQRCELLAQLGDPPPVSRPWKLRRWLTRYRAIMALDISKQAELLREHYPAAEVSRMAGAKNPMLATLKSPHGPANVWVAPIVLTQQRAAETDLFDEVKR